MKAVVGGKKEGDLPTEMLELEEEPGGPSLPIQPSRDPRFQGSGKGKATLPGSATGWHRYPLVHLPAGVCI